MSSRKASDLEYTSKQLAIAIGEYADRVIKKDKSKLGILLCEGRENSIDYTLYSELYNHLVVIPSNGCSDIARMVPRVRKYSEYPVFAIIDRDNMSRHKMRSLAERGIFTTRLPFIENIICCPEVLKIVTPVCGKVYSEAIGEIKSSLTSSLVEKLLYLNPFDVDIPKEEEIIYVNITIATKEKIASKRIDLNNVLYTFRDKVIVSEVALVLGLNGREGYYTFIKNQILGENGQKLLFVMGKYLPKIEVA